MLFVTSKGIFKILSNDESRRIIFNKKQPTNWRDHAKGAALNLKVTADICIGLAIAMVAPNVTHFVQIMTNDGLGDM